MCESLEAQVNTHQLERAELDAALADAQAGLTESNVGRSAAEEATAKATEQLAAAAATVAALEGKFKESSAKLGREMKDKIFMHTRHKEEVAKLRRASKAGEYEKRYASLVLENRTLRRFRDAIQGLWKAEKPASSQAVGDEKESKGGDDSEAPKADESTEGGAAGASDTAVEGGGGPGLVFVGVVVPGQSGRALGDLGRLSHDGAAPFAQHQPGGSSQHRGGGRCGGGYSGGRSGGG